MIACEPDMRLGGKSKNKRKLLKVTNLFPEIEDNKIAGSGNVPSVMQHLVLQTITGALLSFFTFFYVEQAKTFRLQPQTTEICVNILHKYNFPVLPEDHCLNFFSPQALPIMSDFYNTKTSAKRLFAGMV